MSNRYHRDPWRPYRRVEDISQAWMPSPVIPPSASTEFSGPVLPDYELRELEISETRSRRRRQTRSSEAREDRTLVRMLKRVLHVGPRHPKTSTIKSASDAHHRRLLPESAWRDFGYWARPTINGVEVENSNDAAPGPTTPANANFSETVHRLRGPHGSPHPEQWIPRLRHPSLPPCPPYWPTPAPGQPIPHPQDCQLNPYLVHPKFGPAPLWFDIGYSITGIVHNVPGNATIPLAPSDFAQPATHPFLTELCISGVADETLIEFPWPMTISNTRGITCEDIFQAVYDNFRELVRREEYENWSPHRQAQCSRTYLSRIEAARCRHEPSDMPPEGDGLRRIDYLGDRVMFRGLEPSPSGADSWIMFLGPG